MSLNLRFKLGNTLLTTKSLSKFVVNSLRDDSGVELLLLDEDRV